MFRDEAPLAQLRSGEKAACAHPPARARENQRRVCIDIKMLVRGLVLFLFAVIRRRIFFPCLAVFVSEGAQAM